MSKILGFLMLSFAIGVAAGYIIFKATDKKTNVIANSCQDTYKYLNPSLDCGYHPVIDKKTYDEFVAKLKSYISEKSEVEKSTHVSVYFRDLAQGPTFGIDEDEYFAPASLLKVPLMVTYLEAADKDPDLLNKKAHYIQVNKEVIPQIKPEEEIKINTYYTIDQLLSHMIVHSDNLAYGLLDKTLSRLYPDDNVYLRTMQGLGLVNPINPGQATFTVKTYASLFRQLYNGSYLSLENSEKALNLLAEVKYMDGLPAGVPEGVLVAHKFGEREILETGEMQFHDCGIIYYPNNPYLLCIMTRGEDLEELISTVAQVSKMVYEEVDSRKI